MKVSEMSIWASDTPDKNRGTAGVTFRNSAEAKPKECLRCKDCKFAQQDAGASEYSRKPCKSCEFGGVNRKKCQYVKNDEVCPKQELLWAAIECTNRKSEFNKALLNVSEDGKMQKSVTWSGCVEGERRGSRWEREAAERAKSLGLFAITKEC